MVVLLCAGNRIAIPDFGQGPAAFFQPVHTMTGIIAQEMGEVVHGSIHYRALFMVGILLFILSLLINYLAQHIVRKFKISIG
jgi:phosphate transport system permease protein